MADLSVVYAALPPEKKAAFQKGPALAPPPGVIPNLINPPNKNALSTGILVATAVVATLAVIVRMYPRFFLVKSIISAWGFFVVWVYYAWGLLTSAGMFVHQWNVPYAMLVDFLYAVLMGSTFYSPVMALVKTTILLDWLHIFIPHRTKDRTAYVIYATLILNIAYYLAGTFVYIFPCNPRKRFWDRTAPGTCINAHAASVAAGIVNVISDYVMLIIPQKIIWNLHMARDQRVGISAIFAIGLFACVCATVRLIYSVKLLMHNEDMTYVMSPVGLWTCGEMASIFLVLGVPSLPRIFKEVQWLQASLTRLRSWTGLSTTRGPHSSKGGLPSWYKKMPTGSKRNDMYSDIEEHTLVETVSKPKGTITRETEVEIRAELR
ncbi:hypothetical protein DM02DRAFT_603906 [Periconia macrospinosa]|uniref:Rhodopsin domain-containing protein n=1 Tax=Periconia macrospinosa TaxID=97972 RepID=A0A2V1D643_9PLEO|nr:hypothetical protein DM02DRAFT_603906 [Periconia macrospinosa]